MSPMDSILFGIVVLLAVLCGWLYWDCQKQAKEASSAWSSFGQLKALHNEALSRIEELEKAYAKEIAARLAADAKIKEQNVDKERLKEIGRRAVLQRQEFYEELKTLRNPFSNLPADEVPWTDANQQEFNRFMHHTETGQNFLQRLRCLEQYQNRVAVLQHEHSPYMCGFAAGWARCTAYILSSKSALQDGQPETALPKPGDKQPTEDAPFDPAEHYRA